MSLTEFSILTSLYPGFHIQDWRGIIEVFAAGGGVRDCLEAFRDGPLREFLLTDTKWCEKTKAIQEWANRSQVKIIYPGHAAYPHRFYEVHKPPLCLYMRGGLSSLPHLAVVGSREPSDLAKAWVELHLTEFLRKNKVVITSGAARGVDQLAHTAALRTARPTVAFLPSSLDRIYPTSFSEWLNPILSLGGAVISEYPPKTEVRRHHFERRNRLIAGLCPTVFVVEARRASGSLITADLANRMGATACILPSSPMDAKALGTVDLLCAGAPAVRDAQDLELIMGLNARPSAE